MPVSRTGTWSRSSWMPSPPLLAISTEEDVRDEMPGPGMVRTAETQRIEDRDRPRAHRKNIAQDTAHPGRRALIRLDEGGMIVALDLKDHGVAIADIDDAGVLARTADHTRSRRRQCLEPDL